MGCSRTNNATHATINQSRVYAQGTFKLVYLGKYTQGRRAGQQCVAKEFRTGCVYEEHYFDEEMAVIERARRVIDDWNAENVIMKTVLLNTPSIWTYEESLQKTLIEPFIEDYEKFNSNSGWADRSGSWSKAMQALSHFSYHNSGGQFLLCDLQGGFYQNGIILSDPVIMSQLQNFGPADLGPAGIRSFFARHQCSGFCSNAWTRPRIAVGAALVPMREGTTMTAGRRITTRASRNPLSRLTE